MWAPANFPQLPLTTKGFWPLTNHPYMKEVFFFLFYPPLWWDLPNQNALRCVLGIIGKLSLSMGATLWSFRAKVINYSTIFSLQIVWEFEMFLVFLESLERIRFNGIYFIIFSFKVWKKLSFGGFFYIWNSNKLQKLDLEEKISWVCSHLCQRPRVP
jgi:hypothetical protein